MKFLAIKNQQGAALLLTLFIIVFVAIIAAGLLNTTFYGKKANITALAEQQEFYQLEAALDLMLHEMETFSIEDGVLMYDDTVNNPSPVLDDNGEEIPIIKSGPYYYIETGQPLDVTYNVAGQPVKVTVTYEPYHTEEYKQYTYHLVSQYENSKLKRSLEMKVSVPYRNEFIVIPPPEPGQEGPPQPPKFPGNSSDRIIYIDSVNVHHKQTDWKNLVVSSDAALQSFINYYGLDPSQAKENWNGIPVKDVDKIRYYNEINASGNAVSIAIPEGYLTYANDVNITGCGSDGNVSISGVLITKKITIGGNCTYYLAGGIIAGNFTVSSNASEIVTDDKGGFQDDGGAGEYVPNPPSEIQPITSEDFIWGANITPEIIDMDTNRK